MFYSVGTLLPSPLDTLLNLLSGLMFRDDDDEDETDEGDQDSDTGDSDELDDDEDDEDDDDEEEDDEDEDDDDDEEEDDDLDDLDDDLDNEEITRRNADSALSKKDRQVEASLAAIVKTMAKNPDSAESMIEDLQSEQPELAARLAKLFENEKSNSLKAALKDAPDSVRGVLEKLVDEIGFLKKSDNDKRLREERKLYKEWERSDHPYLNPKSEIGKTKRGQKLIKEFGAAVNRLPSDEPISEDMLEDALAIAKRRAKWQDDKVTKAARKQAKEQAQKARSGAVGTGKGGSNKGKATKAEPNAITKQFGNSTDEKELSERQKKVNAIKAKRFKNVSFD